MIRTTTILEAVKRWVLYAEHSSEDPEQGKGSNLLTQSST